MLLELLEPLAPELLWLIIVSFVIAFLLAFSVGANDVSNSFGTSVGSKVLTVTQACILATIFEVAGATLLGYSVCDTFRRNIYDVSLYQGAQKELFLGALSCLIGSAIWNLVATALKMPISGTHSIIGATIGFSVVLRGWESIKWSLMARIVASWFASPLISGTISSLIYVLVSRTVIRKIDPLRYGLKALPLFYGATIFINVASIVIDGPEVFGLNTLKWYHGLFISLMAAGATISYVALVMVPKLRRSILGEIIQMSSRRGGGGGGGSGSKPSLAPQRLEIMSAKSDPTASQARKSTSFVEKPSVAGYDNDAFKGDSNIEQLKRKFAPLSSVSGTGKSSPDAKTATVRSRPNELTLDANQLAELTTSSRGPKPPIAPKPAHLTRQLAQDTHTQLEEVDLSGPPSAVPTTNKKNITDLEVGRATGGSFGGGGPSGNGRPEMISGERYEVFRLFSTLQILTACFASFAHGSNDVSNAVAPLIPIWNIYANGEEDISQQTPIWILAFGGIGICTGLWAWGRAVMATVGEGLTKLTPSKGFSIELGAAISVLFASKLGLPISTTHCKVGSVVIVGLVSSKFLSQDNLLDMSAEERDKQAEGGGDQAVDWKLFGNIAITWIVTVPLAAMASAIIMIALRWWLL